MNDFFTSIVETRLVRSCARTVNRLARLNKPVVVHIGSHALYAQTIDRLVALYLLKFGANESFEARLFQRQIQSRMRVMDVGANLGFYTLLAAQGVGPQGHVYAFEPDLENYRLLQLAILENDLTNVEALQKAVSNVTGAGTLYICPEHRGDHRVYDSSDGRKGAPIETVRLDDVVEKGEKIDVIKMDIQGAEGMALEGMSRIIADNPALILMTEFWPWGLQQSGVAPGAFLDRIQGFGFRLGLIDDDASNVKEVTKQDLLTRCTGKLYGNLFLTRGDLPTG